MIKRIAIWTVGLSIVAALTVAAVTLTPKVLEMRAAEQDASTSGARQTTNTATLDNNASVEVKAPKATKVQVCGMFPLKMQETLILPGTFEPYEDVELSVKQAGAIQVIHHEEGAFLKKGEPLFELDIDEYKALLEQAKVAVELAEKQYARNEQMSKKGVVALDEFDRAETELLLARAALKLAEVKVERGIVRSPIDGFFNKRMVDHGEYVNPGQVIARIVDINRLKAVVAAPEMNINFFKPGDPATVSYKSTNAATTSVAGQIAFVAMADDNASHTYPVKVVVDNKGHLMRPGRFVEVELTCRANDRTLAAPFFAIINQNDERSVFIEEDGIAREVKVELGFISGSMIEVTKGLKTGDRLIVVGQRDLVDGARVQVESDLTALARQMVEQGLDPSQLGLQALENSLKDRQ